MEQAIDDQIAAVAYEVLAHVRVQVQRGAEVAVHELISRILDTYIETIL